MQIKLGVEASGLGASGSGMDTRVLRINFLSLSHHIQLVSLPLLLY
jgi:hypothetical protein